MIYRVFGFIVAAILLGISAGMICDSAEHAYCGRGTSSSANLLGGLVLGVLALGLFVLVHGETPPES